jgi:ribonuclease-3 family protein
MSELLGERSVRTLAWLGDAEFEREVRIRLARRGDYPTDRLHAMKALVVCAEAQAELLAVIEAELDEVEAGVVRRARNLNHKAGGRGVRSTRQYRAATGLEALVGALVLLCHGPGAGALMRWWPCRGWRRASTRRLAVKAPRRAVNVADGPRDMSSQGRDVRGASLLRR